MINENGKVAHYTRFENFDKILPQKRIRLSPVEKLADPREYTLDWIDTIGLGHNFVVQEFQQAEDLKESVGSKLRIFCVADRNDHGSEGCFIESSIYGRPRMWSQYGDDSKGFCIVFDKERLNFKINGLAEKTDYLISGRVEYYEWLHLIGGGATIEYGQNINLSDSDVFEIINYNRMLHSIYLKKSIDWRDECEFRWLLFSNESNPLFVSIVDTVEAVVLGCGFPIDKYEKAREYCDSLNCPCYILQYQHPQYQLLKI